jgi:hypothetical protein
LRSYCAGKTFERGLVGSDGDVAGVGGQETAKDRRNADDESFEA